MGPILFGGQTSAPGPWAFLGEPIFPAPGTAESVEKSLLAMKIEVIGPRPGFVVRRGEKRGTDIPLKQSLKRRALDRRFPLKRPREKRTLKSGDLLSLRFLLRVFYLRKAGKYDHRFVYTGFPPHPGPAEVYRYIPSDWARWSVLALCHGGPPGSGESPYGLQTPRKTGSVCFPSFSPARHPRVQGNCRIS